MKVIIRLFHFCLASIWNDGRPKLKIVLNQYFKLFKTFKEDNYQGRGSDLTSSQIYYVLKISLKRFFKLKKSRVLLACTSSQ